MTMRLRITCAAAAVALLPIIGPAIGPAAADPVVIPLVAGVLLPIPAAGIGQDISVQAVDGTPSGMVAGNATVLTTNPDGTQNTRSVPLRWSHVPGRAWRLQRLALPAGASASVVGLSDLGRAGGNGTTADGTHYAVRWSPDGRSVSPVGRSTDYVTAVGPDGSVAVSTSVEQVTEPGEPASSELVAADGTVISLAGPGLDGTVTRVLSVADRHTALLVTRSPDSNVLLNHELWRDGRTTPLAVTPSSSSPACISPLLAGGNVVASARFTPRAFITRHTGGVPGRNLLVDQAAAGVTPAPGLACLSDQPEDKLAADGGIAGSWGDLSDGAATRAAYWDAHGARVVVPLAPGEVSAFGAVVATGGRMVIRGMDANRVEHLWLWHAGRHAADLSLPTGWQLDATVELTDTGLLIANVRDLLGQERPVVWNLAGN